MSSYLFLMELYPNIGSCQLYIFPGDIFDSSTLRVSVKETSVELYIRTDTGEQFEQHVLHTSPFTLIPSRCAPPRASDDGQGVVCRLAVNLVPFETRASKPAPAFTYKYLQCRFCRSDLQDVTNSFLNVYPLPSQGWEDFADCLSCHGTMTQFSYQRLIPKRGSCMVGDTYILVNPDDLLQEALRVTQFSVRHGENDAAPDGSGTDATVPPTVGTEPNCTPPFAIMLTPVMGVDSAPAELFHQAEPSQDAEIACRRCSSILGKAIITGAGAVEHLKILQHVVIVDPHDHDALLNRECYIDAYIVDDILSKSRQYCTNRFIIGVEHDNLPVPLLLRILNHDVMVWSNQYFARHQTLGKFSGIEAPTKGALSDNSQVTIKCMYNTISKRSSTVEKAAFDQLIGLWVMDSVQEMVYPPEVFYRLQLLLHTSSCMLPAMFRTSCDMSVGYLFKP